MFLKKRCVFVYIFYLLPLIFLVESCDDSTTINQIDQTIIPSSNVSFSQHIQPVLIAKCAYSGCHDESANGNIVLTNYYGVVSNPIIIVKYTPQNSKLIQIIKKQVQHSAPFLSFNDNQIAGFETWVKEGAQNN